MAWSVLVFALPDGANSVDDIPNDAVPRTMGTRDHVIEEILRLFPGTSFDQPWGGELISDTCSMDFSLGDMRVTEVQSFSISMRRGGKIEIRKIRELVDALEASAFDCQTSREFDETTAIASFTEWGEFRQHVAEESPPTRDS